MMSEEVEGYKGKEDLDSLLMYIEGEKSGGEAQGGKPAKQKRNNGHSRLVHLFCNFKYNACAIK